MEHFLEKVWPHIKDFYKSPQTKEDSKGDNQDKTEETEPVKVDDLQENRLGGYETFYAQFS